MTIYDSVSWAFGPSNDGITFCGARTYVLSGDAVTGSVATLDSTDPVVPIITIETNLNSDADNGGSSWGKTYTASL